VLHLFCELRGSSIPETSVIEPRSRSVLDPRLRGDDSHCVVALKKSIPRDDLAFALMHIRRVE
jgi:hypothetical protein